MSFSNQKNKQIFCQFGDLALSLQTFCRNGGIGRHEGLKIPWPVMAVRVRVPLAALLLKSYAHEANSIHSFVLPAVNFLWNP